MIGIKPKKKKKEDVSIPDINPVKGQASIYGKVTERNIFTNQVTDASSANVSLYQNNTLIATNITGQDGLYIINSINIGDNYRLEISKDSIYISPQFSLTSEQVKEVTTELTTTNFS